jgi:hypothetical protein
MADRKRILNLTRLLVSGFVLLLFITSALYVLNTRRNSENEGTDTDSSNSEDIDLSPGTVQDQQQVDQHKENLVKREAQDPPASDSGKKKVTPTIISASATSVKGFVPGIYESGGSCTAIFTKGSEQFSKQSAAVKGATTTDCTPISMTRGDFPSTGEWSLVLTYSSATAEGSSASQKVMVN